MSMTWRWKSFGEAGRSDPKQTARRRSGASRQERSAPPTGRKLHRDEGPNGRESEPTMSLVGARRQKSTQVELPLSGRGEAPRGRRSGEAQTAANGDGRSGTGHLMEEVV